MDTSAPALIAELERLSRTPPAPRLSKLPVTAVAWLISNPGWPRSLAISAFPDFKKITNEAATVNDLEKLVESGVAEQLRGDPPWSEPWYVINHSQRGALIDELNDKYSWDDVAFLRAVNEAARAMQEALASRPAPPPQLDRWIKLAVEPSVAEMAKTLDAQVATALAQARQQGQTSAPEALRWMETAEPLMQVFGGELNTALARSSRRLELFHRQSRDARLLKNYVPRQEQEAAFLDLLRENAAAWAIHYIGYGGAGKTMLMRQIKTGLAQSGKQRLVTARVDFDNLNPNFPARAPGLLLMGFAEELRLHDDATVYDLFGRFDRAIQGVHRRVESTFRVGSAAAAGGAGRLETSYADAEREFIGALKRISETATPVLILDTCEELAKVRSGANLPEALLATFDILERLHDEVDRLRVVLSGRRMLAGAGHRWLLRGSSLPPRPYLKLAELRGFDRHEAATLIRDYRREGRAVSDELAPLVLSLSHADEGRITGSVEWDAPLSREADQRYNPYDLDLFASLCCEKTPPTPDQLRGGRESFVRERLVNRLTSDMRGIVSEVAVLGRFDRELIEALTGRQGPAFEALWEELKGQEWTDVDRSARGGVEVWGMEPHIQKRMLEFITTTEWDAACRRLRPLLRDVTISRPWDDLIASYFVVMLDILSDEPVEAAHWWSLIEERIWRTGQWEWAREITSLLADEEGVVGEKRHLLRPAVLATRAAAMLRLGPEDLASLWQEVLNGAARHPEPDGVALLNFRALAGLVTTLRLQPDAIIEDNFGQVEAAARRLFSLDPLPKDLATSPQVLGSEAGWMESVADIVEQINWRGVPPRSLITALRERASRLLTAPPFADVALLLQARFLALEDVAGPITVASGATVQSPGFWFLDWLAPRDPSARIRLENARLNRAFLRCDFTEAPTIESLDDDRFYAIQLQAAADYGPVLVDVGPAIDQSISLVRLRPECLAHAIVPPFFAVALEVGADSGIIPDAWIRLQNIASDSRLPLDTRQAAQRASVRLAIRDRAVERSRSGSGVLEQSSKLGDALLIVGQDVFDSKRGDRPYAGRWREAVALLSAKGLDPSLSPSSEAEANFDALSLYLDEADSTDDDPTIEALPQWERLHQRAWLERATLRVRLNLEPQIERWRTARLMFDEGALLSLRQPQRGARILEAAAQLYLDVGDVLGQQRSTIAAALAWARAGDKTRLQQAVAHSCLPPGGLQPTLGEAWSLRLQFARCRAVEFQAVGQMTKQLLSQALVGSSAGGALPLDMQGVLVADAPASTPNRLKLSDIGILLLGLAALGGMAFGLVKVVQSSGGELGYRLDADAAVGWIVGGAIVAAVLPWTIRFYLALLFRLVRAKVRITPDGAVSDLNRPMRAKTQLASTIELLSPLFSFAQSSQALPASDAETYAEMSPAIAPRFWTPIPFPRLAIPSIAMEVDPRCAATCWEAVLSLRGGSVRSMSRVAFQYRRTGLTSFEEAATPIAKVVNVHLWATGKSMMSRTAWRTSGTPEKYKFLMYSRSDSKPWEDSAVLHIVCEVVDGSGGLEMHLSKDADSGDDEVLQTIPGQQVDANAAQSTLPASRRSIPPRMIAASGAARPRLCILQGFDLPEPRRSATDRHAAGLVRRAAAELFEAGIPAVLVIPSLPETLSARVVKPVVKAVTSGPRRGASALMSAVREMQNMIAPGKDDADALERAFDVCLYCVDDLSLVSQA